MKSLMIILDSSAPSLCYYHRGIMQERMAEETFESAIALVKSKDLFLQVVTGPAGIPDTYLKKLEACDYIAYLPASISPKARPQDVLIIDSATDSDLELVPQGHPIVILRMSKDHLGQLPALCLKLAERVQRIVLVLTDILEYTISDIEVYQHNLSVIKEHLLEMILDKRAIEINVITDRLMLDEPRECSAGLEHLTMAPSGSLHLCPAFALDANHAHPLGIIGPDWVADPILSREKAPICISCDAFHCRRCVYLNKISTLELNTPPWQLCRISHVEREISRQLLQQLQDQRFLQHLPSIQPVHYQDPLLKDTENTLPMRRRGKRGNVPEGAVFIGLVTPDERDTVRILHLRRQALKDLLFSTQMFSPSDIPNLYEKIISDLGKTIHDHDQWWDEMALRYSWKSVQGYKWHLDFSSCEVMQIPEDEKPYNAP